MPFYEIVPPPLLPQAVLCLSSVARSLVGVAGGATRAAITQHQARANNISDVAAKDGSQETLVNLAALLVNLAVLPWLGEDSLSELNAFTTVFKSFFVEFFCLHFR